MKLRILMISANPLDSSRLDIAEEARAIREKLRLTPESANIDLRHCEAARPDDLLHELNEHRPHIVHFSGHGEGEPGIVMTGPNADTKVVSGAALGRLFRVLKDNIRVVVLNACDTTLQASEIAQDIDFTVGMSSTIGDDAARVFSSSFYRAIAFGRSVENAFEQGLAAIALDGLRDDDVPQLFTRDGIDVHTVLLPKSGAGKRHDDAGAMVEPYSPEGSGPGGSRAAYPASAELGLFDYREILDQQLEIMTETGAVIAAAMGVFRAKAREFNQLVKNMAPADIAGMSPKDAKRLLNDVAASMEGMNLVVREKLPAFAKAIDHGIGAMNDMTDIMQGIKPPRETLQSNLLLLRKYDVAFREAHDSLAEYQASFALLPSLTKELNAAKGSKAF
jgi:hypothetical protein